VAIGVAPSRVQQRGPSPRAALTVALVALVSIVGIALLGKDPATSAAPSSPPAALAARTPTLAPSVAPSFEAATVAPSPAPSCVTPRVVALTSPIARHPRPLSPTGVETVTPWTGSDGALVADSQAGFWAFGSGRLMRLDASGRMTASWTFADDPHFGASGIVAARGGGVWLWGGPDVAWFDGERFRDVIASPIPASSMAWVTDVAEASDGTLWAVADDWTSANEGLSSSPDGRVFHWDGQRWSDVCRRGPGNELAHVTVDAAGGVWVAPGNATVDASYFDGSTWSVPPSDPAWLKNPARVNGWTSGLVAANDGSVWQAAGGLAHFDGKAWMSVVAEAVDLSGTVSLAVAPDGTVWAATGSLKLPGDGDGSHSGIVLARLAGDSWTIYGAASRLPAPRPLDWATITAVAASRDMVVAATRDGFYRLSGERWVRTGAPPGKAPTSPDTLLAVSSDEAWATGWDAGLWHFHNDTWTSVPVPGWKPPVQVFGIARAQDSSLAVATDHGAAVLRKGRWTILGKTEAHAVGFGRDGAIWVAERALEDTETTVASFRFDGRAWARTALPAVTTAGWPSGLVVAADGEILLLSRGWVAALDRFDGTRWVPESPLGGSRSDNIAGLAVAPNGDIWAVSGGGDDPSSWTVARYEEVTWTAQDVSDGLVGQGYLSGIAIAPDGSLWVSTDRGLTQFDGERRSHHLAGYGFRAPCFAPDGTLWVVGPSGVQRLAAGHLVGPDPFPR
jgi:hypothetical protein